MGGRLRTLNLARSLTPLAPGDVTPPAAKPAKARSLRQVIREFKLGRHQEPLGDALVAFLVGKVFDRTGAPKRMRSTRQETLAIDAAKYLANAGWGVPAPQAEALDPDAIPAFRLITFGGRYGPDGKVVQHQAAEDALAALDELQAYSDPRPAASVADVPVAPLEPALQAGAPVSPTSAEQGTGAAPQEPVIWDGQSAPPTGVPVVSHWTGQGSV